MLHCWYDLLYLGLLRLVTPEEEQGLEDRRGYVDVHLLYRTLDAVYLWSDLYGHLNTIIILSIILKVL
jgi:hypothetical protein